MLSIAYHLRCYQLLSISKSKRFAAILVCIFRLFFSILSKTLCSKDCATSTRVKNSRDQVLDNSICKSVSLRFWRIHSWTIQLTSSRFLSGVEWPIDWYFDRYYKKRVALFSAGFFLMLVFVGCVKLCCCFGFWYWCLYLVVCDLLYLSFV